MANDKASQPYTSTERNELSAKNAAPVSNPPNIPPARPRAVRGTAENDAAIAAAYPQLGDSVRVDVDLVPYMDQGEIHQRIKTSGVHGRLGTVVGMEVQGNLYMLRIETSSGVVLVPADCVEHAEPLPSPQEMQQPRQSPEKMRKPPTPGAYKLT